MDNGNLLLHGIVRVRESMGRRALMASDPDLHDAWFVCVTRFTLLVASFADPDYLEANNDVMVDLGLVGPEIAVRVRALLASTESDDDDSFIQCVEFARALSALPVVGPSARAIAQLGETISHVSHQNRVRLETGQSHG